MNRTRLASSRQVTNVAELLRYRSYLCLLPPVPIQVAAIPVDVAILAPQLSSFMPCRRIVSVVEVAPQFPAVMHNPHLIAPDVAPVPPVAIFSKHRARAHSDQQQNPSHRAFHIPLSFRSPLYSIPGLAAREPRLGM